MPNVITEAKSAPKVMLEALEDLFKDGWQVVSIIEQAFAGELTPPSQHDVGVCDPKNVTVAHFFLPHGDHFHEWVIVLAKAGVDLNNRTLGTDFVTLLKMMDMDERSNTLTAGHA